MVIFGQGENNLTLFVNKLAKILLTRLFSAFEYMRIRGNEKRQAHKHCISGAGGLRMPLRRA